MEKRPNPTDQHVGARVRMRRILMAMSQEKLGEALGVTFQQVQKYEKGVNRVSASRLQKIAETLGVTPAYFFEGAPGPELEHSRGFAEESVTYVANFLSTAEGLQLNKAFARIQDAKVRRRIVDLVVSLADKDPSDAGARSI